MSDFPRCKTCKHWGPPQQYSYFARCREIEGSLEIELRTGWNGGFVEQIETEDDFGCIKHEPKP